VLGREVIVASSLLPERRPPRAVRAALRRPKIRTRRVPGAPARAPAAVVLDPELGDRLFGDPVVPARQAVVADVIGGDIAT
jgi:hypothetical protein